MLSYAHRAVPRQCAGAQAQAAVLRDERADEGSAWGLLGGAVARAFRSVALAFPFRSLQSNAQLDGAHEYLKKIGATELDAAALEASAGVGVVVRGCMGHTCMATSAQLRSCTGVSRRPQRAAQGHERDSVARSCCAHHSAATKQACLACLATRLAPEQSCCPVHRFAQHRSALRRSAPRWLTASRPMRPSSGRSGEQQGSTADTQEGAGPLWWWWWGNRGELWDV